MTRFITSLLITFSIFFSHELRAQDPVVMLMDPTSVTAASGESVSFTIRVENFTNIISMQFSVNFDTTVMQFVSVTGFTPNLPGFGSGSVGTPTGSSNVPNGVITVSWLDFALQARTLSDGEALFTMNFTAIGPQCASGAVAVTDKPNIIEFFTVGPGGPFDFVPIDVETIAAVGTLTMEGSDCSGACGIGNLESGTDVTIQCDDNTIGSNNDAVTILIDYTGSDAAAVLTNNGGGTIGGDDPAVVANGTIEITGLMEGDSWNISLTGGGCDFTSTGSIPANNCDPVVCGITSLESGAAASLTCNANTTGANNDGVTVSLDYAGSDPNATIVNNGSGVIGGDNPATVANGTIEITGLSEGDSWDIEIVGGTCSLQSSGTIGSNLCDPAGCGVTDMETGNEVTINCTTQTLGDDNDAVTIEINYFGQDAAALLTNNGAGTLGGDNPASISNGTITLTGLLEGDVWDITLSGGNCDLQSTGQVASDYCAPAPCGITNIETGNEVNFICGNNSSSADPVTIEIAYSGVDANAVILNNGGGSISGDNPATTPNGTILISGLQEGDMWDIEITGGSCTLSSMGTVPGDICLPLPCAITDLETGAEVGIFCQTNTPGDNNDGFILEIAYVGVDANAVVVNNGAGTIGGDNPAAVNNGKITISGLQEGDSWDISISGGQCNLQSTGTVAADYCDVAGCGISAIQTGNQVSFNCQSNTTGADNDNVTIEIAYTGIDQNASIENNGGGTISGNNPAITENGTILIFGLGEGDTWDISITGGQCNLQSTGTVPSLQCDPDFCGITSIQNGSEASIICASNTNGGANDNVTVQIAYLGVDSNITVTNNGLGTIGGDNPATVANGVIEINGLKEGDNWNITLSGGVCNLSSTGTVGANYCDPVPCGITDIESGAEASITCQSNTAGNGNDNVLIEIGYMGIDPSAVVINNGGGTIGGNNPATVTNGTITISGLKEGDTWDISISGGLCSLQSTGTVAADLCEPSNCGVTDIESGNEVHFICLENTTANTDEVIIQIDYAGVDPGVTLINSGAGVVGGDNPKNTPDGTIEITGIQEGQSWNITLSGNGCNLTSSGMVSGTTCTPTTTSDSLVLFLPNETVFNGDQICLEVSVENFVEILAMQYSINFDPTILEFESVSGFNLVGLGAGNFGTTLANNGMLNFSWDAISSGNTNVTLPDGTIIYEICFNVIGGGGSSTDVSFTSNPTPIEVINGSTMNIGLIDQGGVVSVDESDPNTLIIDISETEGVPGDTVCVDFVVENFTDILAVQFGVAWDQSVLSFVEANNFNSNLDGLSTANFNNVADGIILSWNDPTIQGISMPNGAVMFSLCFEIIGTVGESSNVSITDDFTTVEIIDNNNSLVNLNPIDGKVDVLLGPTTDATIFVECASAPAGSNVCFPVKMNNFNNLVGVQFTLAWDDTVLDYVDVDNFNGPLNVNASNFGTPDQVNIPDNALTFSWSDPFVTGQTIPDGSVIFEVCFDVIGNTCDSSSISFINTPTIVELITLDGPVPYVTIDCDFKTSGCFGLELDADVTPTSCNNGNDGAITLNISGGTPPYIIEWADGGDMETIENLVAGNYAVTITDDAGTILVETITVTQPPAILINGSTQDVSCFGSNNGSITTVVSGGVAPYLFDWSNNNLDGLQNPSGLAAGDYGLTITDANGCTQSTTITVSQPAAINISSSITGALNGVGGAINLTVSGGDPGYAFAWSNGATTEDISNVGPGSYSVTVTDAKGCTKTANYTIIDISNCAVSLSYNSFATSCSQASNGSINLTVNNATSPISYNWTGPSTPANIQDPGGLAAGTYCVTVTDAIGCTADTCITVTAGPGINVLASAQSASCAAASNGSITLTVTAATGPFTYDWDDDTLDGIKNPTGLAPGTYCVTVTDANSCPKSTCVTVQAGNGINVVATPEEVTCNGGADGEIAVSITNGSGSYSYTWSDLSLSGANPANLSPGTYTVTVTDNSSGCTGTATAVVTEPSLLDVNAVPTNVTCFGAADGMMLVNVQGGVNPYNYTWSSPDATGGNPSSLAPGNYAVTVTDANGCTGFDEAIINDGVQISVSLVESSNPACFGEASGSITVLATGGTAPYNYQWINTATGNPVAGGNQTIDGLLAGSYTVEVTDAKNCAATLSAPVVLTQPAAITINATVFDPTPGQSNGQITLNISGGTSPYNFTWSGGLPSGAGQNNQPNLSSGVYSVTVTDAKGCTKTGTYEAIANFILSPAIVTDVACHGDSTGSINITPLGGLPPYEYLWSPNGETTEDVSALKVGTYNVTVTDQKGTVLQQTYQVKQPNASIALSNVDIDCDNGSGNGSINISVNGGTLPYSFAWSNGSLSEDVQNLSAGFYKVTITDGKGCVFVSDEIEVCFLPNPPVLISLQGINPSCSGSTDGSISVEVQSLGQPITYQWISVPPCSVDTLNVKNPTGLSACTYVLVATDAFGQTLTASVTLSDPSSIFIGVDQIKDESCPAGDNGSITVTVAGGTPPYTYEWSNGANSTNISGLSAGFYTLSVTDSKGCLKISSNIQIKEQPPCFAGATITEVDCAGDENGAITVDIDGVATPYSYKWKDDDGNTIVVGGDSIFFSPTLTGLSGGNYFVTVTDANGSTQASVFFVPEPNPVSVNANIIASTSGSNGAIDIMVTGGTGPFTFQWSDGSTQGDRVGLAPGIYDIVITDSKGCIGQGSFQVNGPPLLSASVQNEGCQTASDGSINLEVQGVPDFNYTWQGPNAFTANSEDISGLAPGTYFLTVTDGTGTTSTSSYTVGTNSFLEINALLLSNPVFPSSNDGQAGVTATNGVEPYTYQWCSGESQAVAVQLPVGTCVVTVTDAQGCEATDTITLTSPSIPVTFKVEAPTCPGECDAEAEVLHQGGRAPFTYEWSDSLGQITRKAVMLCPGSYTVTITDNAGYFEIQEVLVPDAVGMDITFQTVPSVQRDGEIEVIVDGGVEPYFYLWSNGSRQEIIRGLNAGEYSVTVTDGQGCEQIAMVTLEGNYDCGQARNVITPNLDGRNDNFIVSCAEVFQNTLRIFDRWGQLMYMAENYDNTWEGRDMNGNDLPEGGYFYIFEYDDADGFRQVKGSITIVRE